MCIAVKMFMKARIGVWLRPQAELGRESETGSRGIVNNCQRCSQRVSFKLPDVNIIFTIK